MDHSVSHRISTKDIVLIGMFAAFLAVMSQIALPMPSGVPVTIQVFAVAMAGAVLGWKRGLAAVVVYILVGTVGLPVFANFKGGPGVITGVTGGYILAWPAMAALCGLRTKFGNEKLNTVMQILFAIIGLAICESMGALQWAVMTDGNFGAIMIYSFAAFIPKDTILTVLAVLVGRKVRQAAIKAGGLD